MPTPMRILASSEESPPIVILASLDGAVRSQVVTAAEQHRLVTIGGFALVPRTTQTALSQVSAGVLGLIAISLGVPLVISQALMRTHGEPVQMSDGVLLGLFLVNIVAGIAAILWHDGLHALTCRALGGHPDVHRALEGFGLVWTAPEQGFGRNTYATLRIAPLVVGLILWVIFALTLPIVAAYLWAGLVAHVAASTSDLWIARAVLAQPPEAVAFTDAFNGFTTYGVAAAPTTRTSRKARPTA